MSFDLFDVFERSRMIVGWDPLGLLDPELRGLSGLLVFGGEDVGGEGLEVGGVAAALAATLAQLWVVLACSDAVLRRRSIIVAICSSSCFVLTTWASFCLLISSIFAS